MATMNAIVPVFLFAACVFGDGGRAVGGVTAVQSDAAGGRQADALRKRHGPDPRHPAAVRRPLPPDGHRLSGVRRGTVVPLSLGGGDAAGRASGGRGRRDGNGELTAAAPTGSMRPSPAGWSAAATWFSPGRWSSSPCWPPGSSTTGARGFSNGGSRSCPTTWR